jgi:hypothetical protein
MIHLLLHGHRAQWFLTDYDFLTWKHRCAVCEPDHPDAPIIQQTNEASRKLKREKLKEKIKKIKLGRLRGRGEGSAK